MGFSSDTPNDLLHNVKLGLIQFSLSETIKLLPAATFQSATMLLSHILETIFRDIFLKQTSLNSKKNSEKVNYSGFKTPFRSNLKNRSKFKGREFGSLCQIFPITMRNTRAPSHLTKFWLIIGEVIPFSLTFI